MATGRTGSATNSEQLFRKVRTYAELSQASATSWQRLLRPEFYKKGECFVELGQVPSKVGFVLDGLFAQDCISESGA